MRFIETPLEGAWIVELEPIRDDRGFFSRVFCAEEFRDHGLEPELVQGNMSFNQVSGTLRGMHYQLPPATETKFMRCTRGAIFDAIIDLRPDSPSYLQSYGVELTADNRRALYVPGLFGHGYMSLTDDTEVIYFVNEFYAPGHERGLRWNDPIVDIEWPMSVSVVSEKDASWPDFSPEEHAREIG